MLASQSAGYTMQDMCAQWSGNGYIGNPSDCTSWGYCKAQQLVGYGTCGANLVYESMSQTCQPASTTACSTSVQKTCSALKTTGYVADPTDCTKYAYCFGNGQSQTVSCPTGQTYAANNNTCVWGPSCAQDSICRFMPNNIFVGDPQNCGQYLHCINGYGVWGSCPTDLYYNAAIGVCQKTNPCTDTDNGNNNNNNGDGNSALPPSTISTCTAGKFQSDGETCYGFYYCKSKSQGIWGSCPFGLEFSEDNQTCVSPASLACEHDRCANTNLTYAAVAGTECQEYRYCPTGVKGYYCKAPYSYFDEINGVCVQKKPTYPICGVDGED